MRRFIKFLPALLLLVLWPDAPIQAETVLVKSGYVTTTDTSRGRFSIAGPGLVLNGRVHTLSVYNGGGILIPKTFFRPGIYPYLDDVAWQDTDTLFFDPPMIINWKQYLIPNSSISAKFTFSSPPLVVPPPGPTSLKITLPFNLSGYVYGYTGNLVVGPSGEQLFGVSLSGQGTLTMEFTRVNTQAFGEVYRLENSTYTFDQTPVTPPLLLTEDESNSALALDSVTLRRGPFSVTSPYNLSSDRRTRLTLLGLYLDLQPGEDISVITAQAEDARGRVYALGVEHIGKVQNISWLDQLTVRVPDELAGAGDVRVSVGLHGQVSNKVLVNFNSTR